MPKGKAKINMLALRKALKIDTGARSTNGPKKWSVSRLEGRNDFSVSVLIPGTGGQNKEAARYNRLCFSKTREDGEKIGERAAKMVETHPDKYVSID